jgi:hypothetical protein
MLATHTHKQKHHRPHLQGFAVASIEIALRPQESREEEVKEGPQLKDVVLDGRPTQDQPVMQHPPRWELRLLISA